MGIAENYQRLRSELAHYPQAKLVAVVKKRDEREIRELIKAGAEMIAFSTVQDAFIKLAEIRFQGETHFIGRLQQNKVRRAVQLFDVIQSVDSLTLARNISAIAAYSGKMQRVYLQINAAEDPQKAGFTIAEFEQAAGELARLPNFIICGFMTIGKADADELETRRTFRILRKLMEKYRESGLLGKQFKELSMGMSADYALALEEGATRIRVGTSLFDNPQKSG